MCEEKKDPEVPMKKTEESEGDAAYADELCRQDGAKV